MENSNSQIILDELYANFLSRFEINFKNYVEKDLAELHLKYSSQFKEEWKKFYNELSLNCSKINEEKINLEKEKKIIEEITKNVKDDDILCLNISGKEMFVKRSILTQIKGSNLEILIKNDDRLLKDKNKNIYFDFDYDCFKIIVDYLKLKALENNENKAPLPLINESLSTNFNFLVNYLGISNLFKEQILQEVPKKNIEQFDLKFSSGNYLNLTENDTILTSKNSGHKYILGKNSYSSGKHVFLLETLKLLNNNWMMIGIIDTKSIINLTNNSYSCKGNYGWAGSGQVYVDGNNVNNKDGYNSKEDFLEKDKISLTLNLENNLLTFKNMRNNKEYNLNIPPNCEWKLHINIFDKEDSLKILN